MRRLVTYLRLSNLTEDSTSIARQRADLDAWAAREGLELVRELADEGVSGRLSRANAAEALRMLRDREADVLAVWKLDRWTRQGVRAVADLVDVLDATPGSRFMALSDGLDSTTPAWRIVASVLAEVGRTEAENVSLRFRSSLVHRRKLGRFTGGTLPYGYASVPATDGAPGRVLVPEPHELAVVEELAERILGGESLVSITQSLTLRGEPTARSAFRAAASHGRPTEGLARGVWHVTALSGLMTSVHLLGRARHRGELLTDEDGLPRQLWEPLVAPETFALLRARLGDRSAPREPRERRVKAARLLSGLVFCAYCGSKLYVRKTSLVVYECSRRSQGEACPGPSVSADAIERFVEARYLAVVGRHPELELIESARTSSEVDLADVELALRDAAASLTSDLADVPAVLARMENLKAVRAELQAAPVEVQTVVRPTGRTLAEAWAAAELTKRQQLLGEAVEHVELSKSERRGGSFDAGRVRVLWAS